MRSLKNRYKTDKNLEKTGIELDLGDFVVTVARAGGANKAYENALYAVLAPYQRAIQLGKANEEEIGKEVKKVFAKHVVKRWQTKLEDGSLVEGICLDGDEVEPATVEKITEAFITYPDLFNEISELAKDRSLFLDNLEAASKN